MSTKEQIYYEVLVRTDHPVFYKDFSSVTDINSPLNSIINRVLARQLVKLKSLLDEISLNSYPATVTSKFIDDWEFTFFGFTKPSLSLTQRVNELLIKFNKRFKMNVQDVLDLSKSIVGIEPIVTRNVSRSGWILGQGTLGLSTTLNNGSSPSPNSIGLYLIYFPQPVDSGLLAKLDERLTIIEKAGSRHKVKAPISRWVLGRAALGIDTNLGA